MYLGNVSTSCDGLLEVSEVALCDRHQRQSTQNLTVHSGFQLWRLQSALVWPLVFGIMGAGTSRARGVGTWSSHAQLQGRI